MGQQYEQDKYSVFHVVVNCVIVYIVFIGLGFLIQFLDNKLANENKNII